MELYQLKGFIRYHPYLSILQTEKKAKEIETNRNKLQQMFRNKKKEPKLLGNVFCLNIIQHKNQYGYHNGLHQQSKNDLYPK